MLNDTPDYSYLPGESAAMFTGYWQRANDLLNLTELEPGALVEGMQEGRNRADALPGWWVHHPQGHRVMRDRRERKGAGAQGHFCTGPYAGGDLAARRCG